MDIVLNEPNIMEGLDPVDLYDGIRKMREIENQDRNGLKKGTVLNILKRKRGEREGRGGGGKRGGGGGEERGGEGREGEGGGGMGGGGGGGGVG